MIHIFNKIINRSKELLKLQLALLYLLNIENIVYSQVFMTSLIGGKKMNTIYTGRKIGKCFW